MTAIPHLFFLILRTFSLRKRPKFINYYNPGTTVKPTLKASPSDIVETQTSLKISLDEQGIKVCSFPCLHELFISHKRCLTNDSLCRIAILLDKEHLPLDRIWECICINEDLIHLQPEIMKIIENDPGQSIEDLIRSQATNSK